MIDMLIFLLTLSFSCIFLLVRYMIYLKKLIDKKDLKTRVDGKRLKITYQDNIGLGVRVK